MHQYRHQHPTLEAKPFPPVPGLKMDLLLEHLWRRQGRWVPPEDIMTLLSLRPGPQEHKFRSVQAHIRSARWWLLQPANNPQGYSIKGRHGFGYRLQKEAR